MISSLLLYQLQIIGLKTEAYTCMPWWFFPPAVLKQQHLKTFSQICPCQLKPSLNYSLPEFPWRKMNTLDPFSGCILRLTSGHSCSAKQWRSGGWRLRNSRWEPGCCADSGHAHGSKHLRARTCLQAWSKTWMCWYMKWEGNKPS